MQAMDIPVREKKSTKRKENGGEGYILSSLYISSFSLWDFLSFYRIVQLCELCMINGMSELCVIEGF